MTDVTIVLEGWGGAGWGDQGWGDVYFEEGAITSSLGTITVVPVANIFPTSLLLSATIGNATIGAGSIFPITGVSGSFSLGMPQVLLNRWSPINPDDYEFWSPIIHNLVPLSLSGTVLSLSGDPLALLSPRGWTPIPRGRQEIWT